MNKSSFLIVGQHAVIEALRNPKRKVLKVFITEVMYKKAGLDSLSIIRKIEDLLKSNVVLVKKNTQNKN